MKKLLEVNTTEWKEEAAELKEYFKIFGDALPKEMTAELQALEMRLAK